MIGSHAAARVLDTFFKEADKSDELVKQMEKIHLLRGIEGVEQVTLLYALICKVQQLQHTVDLLKDEYFKHSREMLQSLRQAEAEIQTLKRDRDWWKDRSNKHAEQINALTTDEEKQEEKSENPQGETWLAKF